MKPITELIRERRVYFDGGTGTVLQSMGLAAGEPPELWNLSHPERITELHRAYLEAGCDIIKTNTFGVNRDKYTDFRKLINAAVSCAEKAASSFENKYIAFDMGPTGRMLEPLGDLGFEEAVALFSDNVRAAEAAGADLILIETMNDAYETKAAVLAAKESSSLPVFVTNAYGDDGKLMTGASPEAMVALLEGLSVDALGINCSLGPDMMYGIVEALCKCASVPVIVNPNAGLPAVENGKTVYKTDAQKFSDCMVRIAELGASVLGGCCGTTPEYINNTIGKTADIPLPTLCDRGLTVVSSYSQAVCIGDSPVLIGERINPTGKPRFREALRSEDIGFILNEGLRQADAGVRLLDVNVGLPEIDEKKMLCRTVSELQAICPLPLQLDTSDSAALEAAMRIYNGKPLVNSVNGTEKSMSEVLPLIKRYGGTVIALTLDEEGIPETAAGRAAIAGKIISRAAQLGISKKDIIVDPLALTVSANQDSAAVTLEAIRLIKRLGVKTSLGVSNISFGLPSRDIINSVFFAEALENGLDCAIMNPFSEPMMRTYYAHRLLHGLDDGCADYIAFAGKQTAEAVTVSEKTVTLKSAVLHGLSNAAATAADAMLEDTPPLDVINEHIIPALNEIGTAFEQKTAYLPQLLMSADAASAAFERVKLRLPRTDADKNRRVILATVRGDIHDIGKNIVKVLLESYGFTVFDLGRDVPPERVLDCVRETGCRLVGLSALMTTTVPAMAETIGLLQSETDGVTVMVGGAVLTREYADSILADFYSPDALSTVHFCENYYKDDKNEGL